METKIPSIGGRDDDDGSNARKARPDDGAGGGAPAPCCPLDVAGEDDFRARIAEAEAAVSAGRARPVAEVSADLRGEARVRLGAPARRSVRPDLPHRPLICPIWYHDDADWRYMGQIRRGRGCTSSTTRGCRRGCSPRGPWTCSPRCTSAGAGRPPTSRPTPRALGALVESARVASAGASNRIEGIRTTDARLRGIVEGRAEPRTRDEEEIAGYRDVLATIHESHDWIEPTPRRDPPAPPGPVPAKPRCRAAAGSRTRTTRSWASARTARAT